MPPRRHDSQAANGRRSGGLRLVHAFPLLGLGAVIAFVVVLVMPHHKPFNLTTVRVGDYVSVDNSDHITGLLTQQAALGAADARRVTARENVADPRICLKYHALGRPDVEAPSSISFCLIRTAAAAKTTAQ
jgi:hypothetical protein